MAAGGKVEWRSREPGKRTLAELALRVDGVGEGGDHAEEAREIHGARVGDVPVGNHFLRGPLSRQQLMSSGTLCEFPSDASSLSPVAGSEIGR